MDQVSMRITENKHGNNITLKGGLLKTKSSSSKQMKPPNGSLCQTAKENSEVFCYHSRTLYDRQLHFEESVLDDLPQHPIFEGCDHLPTHKEIIDSTHKLKSKAPGKSGIMAKV